MEKAIVRNKSAGRREVTETGTRGREWGEWDGGGACGWLVDFCRGSMYSVRYRGPYVAYSNGYQLWLNCSIPTIRPVEITNPIPA